MKTPVAVSLLAFGALASNVALAQTGSKHPYDHVKNRIQSEAVAPLAVESPHRAKFRAGVDLYQETYAEYSSVNGRKIMQEKGPLYGLLLGADFPTGRHGQVSVDAVLARGHSKYTGSLMGGVYGSVKVSKIDREMYKFIGTYKHQFSALKGAVLGAGLEYRSLTDRLDQAGSIGYKRKNTAWWLNASVEREFALADKWTLTPQAQFSYLLQGKQTAGVMGGLSFKQTKGYGYELNVALKREFGKRDVTVKPYYRFRDVKRSKLDKGYSEPRNKTNEIGVQMFVTF